MGKKEYHHIELYEEAMKVLEIYSTMVLFAFASHPVETKDKIIRNFIARSIVILKGIFELLKMNDPSDCWILYRCLLDRLFHLKSLETTQSFQAFDDWSFKRQYEYMNNIKGDQEFASKVDSGFFKDMDRHKTRYKSLSAQKIEWHRPHPKKVADNADLDFLYKYGYDHASSYVHPMANDGEQDFLRLTKLAEQRDCGDKRIIFNNSCLAFTVLLQESLNRSGFAWRSIVYDFLNDFRAFLTNGSKKYLLTFYKIGSKGPDFDLCKKANQE